MTQLACIHMGYIIAKIVKIHNEYTSTLLEDSRHEGPGHLIKLCSIYSNNDRIYFSRTAIKFMVSASETCS